MNNFCLSDDIMPEAEVALRLAFYLLSRPGSSNLVSVAIDAAQVQVGSKPIFPLAQFLEESGWRQIEQNGLRPWQGRYARQDKTLEIHSNPGVGDVVIKIGNNWIRAECKKGYLITRTGNPEYRLLREGIGQLMTIEQVTDSDVLIVAVPNSKRFHRLALNWRTRPLIKRCSI